MLGLSVADRMVGMIELVAEAASPVRIRGWDGSEAGPEDAPLMEVRSRRAVRRIMWDPGELGLARAYVAGEIGVEGDLISALEQVAAAGEAIGRAPRLSTQKRLRLVREATLVGAIGLAPRPPSEEITLSGERHSKSRDRDAVSRHYDAGNDFYAHILGPSMVYSCAYWTSPDGPDYDIGDAQRDKFDLVCRKLGLHSGMRVLDVGCGWGSFAMHAAREYGVKVDAITLSHEQVELGRERVAEAGLGDQVNIRLQDWRELDDTVYDAISSIGMAEHVGEERFSQYASALFGRLRPGGRLLNHQIARRPGPAPKRRSFTDAYVFPDGELLPLGTVISALEGSGFEVRDIHGLREHYARTLRAWVQNLEQSWDECVALTSLPRARVWRLYMALSTIGFDQGILRVNETLAVRPHPDGSSSMAPIRGGWLPVRPATDSGPAHN